MKKKTDLSKYKIEYGGEKYSIDPYGDEDHDSKNGLWALACKCAEFVVNDLDGKLFFDTDEQSDMVHESVRDAVYGLIKFRMLRQLNQQLNNQNKSEM